jgi:hypothetical protein
MCSAFLILKYLRRHTLRHTGPPAIIKIKAVSKVCNGHIPFPFLNNLYYSPMKTLSILFCIAILNFERKGNS